MFSTLTTIVNLSFLVNKHSVNGTDEFCLFDVIVLSYNKMILYDITLGVVNTCFIPSIVDKEIITIKDVKYLLKIEVDKITKITINSTSITNLEIVTNCVEWFRGQYIISSIYCKTIDDSWEEFNHSGLRLVEINVLEHIYKLVQYSIDNILLTSIDKDKISNNLWHIFIKIYFSTY